MANEDTALQGRWPIKNQKLDGTGIQYGHFYFRTAAQLRNCPSHTRGRDRTHDVYNLYRRIIKKEFEWHYRPMKRNT
eukprot:4340116-Karenia_brevis.AAC.1